MQQPKRSMIEKRALIIMFVVLALFSVFFVVQMFSRDSTRAKVVFLDVGQGDAALVITPSGRQILIDAGPRQSLGEHLTPYMPISDRSIDMVILTHPDLDHVGGMISVVDRYDIDAVVHSGLEAGSDLYASLAKRIRQRGIPTISAQAGEVLTLDTGLQLEILAPEEDYFSFEPNDYSIVAKLVYGDTSILFTGDSGKSIEYDLTNVYGEHLKSDILKVGHHGSKTSTSKAFLDLVDPQYAIISAGCNNRFGHPHASVIAALFNQGSQIFDTCNDGDIVFESDGELWIRKK